MDLLHEHLARARAPGAVFVRPVALPPGPQRQFADTLDSRLGRFESANGGTIFLEEIGDLPGEIQITLLRVLQEREIERVGGNNSIPVDVGVFGSPR